jgi:hypothetical protein
MKKSKTTVEEISAVEAEAALLRQEAEAKLSVLKKKLSLMNGLRDHLQSMLSERDFMLANITGIELELESGDGGPRQAQAEQEKFLDAYIEAAALRRPEGARLMSMHRDAFTARPAGFYAALVIADATAWLVRRRALLATFEEKIVAYAKEHDLADQLPPDLAA